MKVLFVNTNDTSGGAARAAMRIMRGVQQSGVEAQMFVKSKYSKASDVVPVSKYSPSSNRLFDIFKRVIQKFVNRYHMFKWYPYKRTKQNVFMSDLRSTNIHGALQKLDYDIVHLHWINNRFLDIRELVKIRKPIVWTLHDSWPFCSVCHVPVDCKKYTTHCESCPQLGSAKKQDLAYEVFEKKLAAYKELDLHIVTPSRWLGDCAKNSVLLGRFPVHVIPNCIDTDKFRPLDKAEMRRKLGLSLQKKYLLFGAMHVITDGNKGFNMLLSALKCLSSTEVELIIYGNDGKLDQYAIPIPYHVMGYIRSDDEMAQLYNVADITIVPSLSENLSNTIMESLSCGTPVVAFHIGGNSDMIDHEQNGYLAEENNCEDLANGIQWCIGHNTDGFLSKNAREKVLNNFTIDIVSKQYKYLYESLCE